MGTAVRCANNSRSLLFPHKPDAFSLKKLLMTDNAICIEIEKDSCFYHSVSRSNQYR